MATFSYGRAPSWNRQSSDAVLHFRLNYDEAELEIGLYDIEGAERKTCYIVLNRDEIVRLSVALNQLAKQTKGRTP